MVLNNDVEMIKAFKESRMDIWIGNKQNSIKKLEMCLKYLNDNKESRLKVLKDQIEKALESWNKVQQDNLGCTLENIFPNVNFSGILLFSGINSGEFRGRFYGSNFEGNKFFNPNKGYTSNETLTLNWVAVNNSEGYTANICYNLSNAVLFAVLIFHEIIESQSFNSKRVEVQEEICRFFLREIKRQI